MDDIVGTYQLGSCQQQDKSYPLVEVPEVGMEFYQASLTEVEKLVQSDPDNPDAYYKKAIYLEAAGANRTSVVSG